MPSYAELVFYVFSMSSAVDCRGSKLITPDYWWLWVFCMSLGFQLLQTLVCTTCYLSTLFTVNTFNVFKVGLHLQQNSHSVKLIELILLLQESWRLALRRISCHGRNYSQPYFFKRNQSSDNRSHGFGAKFLLKNCLRVISAMRGNPPVA